MIRSLSSLSSKISFMKNYAVVGHTNPDLDSVASAVSLSHLRTGLDKRHEDTFIPYAAGNINDETKFAFAQVGIKTPEVCEDFSLKALDIMKRDSNVCLTLDPKDSIEEFCRIAVDQNIKTIPVVTKDKKLAGVISRKDLLKFYLEKTKSVSGLKSNDIKLSKIVKLLNAQVITGDDKLENKIAGDVKVGTYSLRTMRDDGYMKDAIVVTGDREELQLAAIDKGAQALVVTRNMPVTEKVVKKAKTNGTVIITTELDVTSTIKALEQSLPIRNIITPAKDVEYFSEDDDIEKIRSTIRKSEHDLFPVVKSDGTFLGVIMRDDVMNPEKKSFILVDHNTSNQYAKGVSDGKIEGIIDHHKIGCAPEGRVDCIFGTTGANVTLIYEKYLNEGEEIPPDLAGLMWLAIISDTDNLTSSTTTERDRNAAKKLLELSGIKNGEEIIGNMLLKREFDIAKTSMQDIVKNDCKSVQTRKGAIFISQIKTFQSDKYLARINEITNVLNKMDSENEATGSFEIITDYINRKSYVIASNKAKEAIKNHLGEAGEFELSRKISGCDMTYQDVYQKLIDENCVLIENGTSRKDQFAPFMTTIFGDK